MTPQDRDREPSLEDLDRRVKEAQSRRMMREGRGPEEGGKRGEGMAAGMRIAVEFVAALAVGTGIGILLDNWLGTAPWMLILFFILGTVAGFLNVYRTAQELDRRARKKE